MTIELTEIQRQYFLSLVRNHAEGLDWSEQDDQRELQTLDDLARILVEAVTGLN